MDEKRGSALYAFRRFGDTALRAAYLCTGDYAEAEDIAQEVFFTLHRNPQFFESDEHLKAWVLRCVMNRCRNYHKSWIRRKRVDFDTIPEELLADGGMEADRELHHAIAALPKSYAAVIYLHCIEGYTIREIAQMLDKNENTVGSLLRRAKQKLRLEAADDAP